MASTRARSQTGGWVALDRGDWADARAEFGLELANSSAPASLDGLARALWWLGDVPGAVDAWERAYVAYQRAGEFAAGARVALWLATEYWVALGKPAMANGWFTRAEDICSQIEESNVHGWLELARAEQARDPSASRTHGLRAMALARLLRDPDLELAALGRVGLAEIYLAQVDEGLSRFDAAMAATTAGEALDLRTLGDLYCAAVLACEITLETSRFDQWNEAVSNYLAKHQHPDLLTFCGTCCAEVMGVAGQWEEEERWLVDTLNTLNASGQHARCVHPATRLAALRLLQGRAEEAEQLLAGYEDLPEATLPIVALYLARGEPALAAARLLRRLNQVGSTNLLAVPLLARLVEVQVTQGDVAGAAATAGQLDAIAASAARDRVRAEAEYAHGVALAAAANSDAESRFEHAIELYTRLQAPYRKGRALLGLARFRAGRSEPAAILSARRALHEFERLGATSDADAAAALLRTLGAAGRTGPRAVGVLSKREIEVLRLLADGLTNAEIAARLFVSTKTVATHVSSILSKLGVRNRAEAGAWAHRNLMELA